MTDIDLFKIYQRKLREALLQSPDALLSFLREHGLRDPSSREALETIFHKTRTSAPSLPIEERRKSKAWLTERGLHSLDDGEL